jgi:dinuclear metal center YbgI/SA1388 family protein
MAHRQAILAHLDALLNPQLFNDYGPNGLQVQGAEQVGLLVSGVTASRALIEAAVGHGAQAILVHHGLFWRGHDGRLTGWLAERVRLLMRHDINLFAYHLPLDAHATLGNNAQLGARLGLRGESTFADQGLACLGVNAKGDTRLSVQDLTDRIHTLLHREPTVVPGDGRPLRRIAWCTGGAQGFFEAAIQQGADAYLTGEISEPQAHLARETGVAFFACGHHATERFGAPAVADHLAQHLGLQHHAVHIDNPA